MKRRMCFVAVFTMFLCVAQAVPAMAQKPTVLKNNEKAKGSTVKDGCYFKFSVPEDTVLFTLWTTSEVEENGLDLYVNGPEKKELPTKDAFDFRERSASSNEKMSWTEPAVGIYTVFVAKVRNGCEFEITARAQEAVELKPDTELKVKMAGDGVNNSKFFYFNLEADAEILNLWTKSPFEKNGFDVFVNGPEQEKYPDSNTYWARGLAPNCNERVFISPNTPPKAGRYLVKVEEVEPGCPGFFIQWKTETVTPMRKGQTVKTTTRQPGEYFKIDVPAKAKQVTVKTLSKEDGAILELYVNGPDDKLFPTLTEYGWKSAKAKENAISVDKPKTGTYYIFVRGVVDDKPYSINTTIK